MLCNYQEPFSRGGGVRGGSFPPRFSHKCNSKALGLNKCPAPLVRMSGNKLPRLRSLRWWAPFPPPAQVASNRCL